MERLAPDRPRASPLPPAVRAATDEADAYYRANKDGIDSWNAYIAEYGLPLAEHSDF